MPSLMLGGVKRLICKVDKFSGSDMHIRHHRGNASANRHMLGNLGAAMRNCLGVDAGNQLARHFHRTIAGGVWQQQNKLLTAVARG